MDGMEGPAKAGGAAAAHAENHEIMRTGSARDDLFFEAIEKTRMPIILTDPNLHDNPIIFANPAFLSLTGYAMEEVVGRNCRMLQCPETDRETVASLRSAIAGRRDIAVELLNRRKDGSTFWNALFVSPVVRDGKPVYFFASQLDVSRRRDAEDALRQSQKMEAVGQLTGGIAHDFNNLLQVVLGYQEMVLRAMDEGALPAWAGTRLRAAQDAARKAATLTQQLLAFSRKQRLVGRVLNLNASLQGIHDLARQTAGDDVAIGMELDPGVPNCQVDAGQFEVALLNVLINARDAMAGREQKSLLIRTRAVEMPPDLGNDGLEPGRYAAVSVTDNGTGMPPEVLARVLDPFFTTKEEGKGTGLGLSMVYGFVKQSGGGIRLRSAPGEGTTVELYFPATAGEAAEPGAARPRSVEGGDETVLVVEDRDPVADVATLFLEGFGYRVLRAAAAREALAVLERERVDLLFSDLVMPGGMSGATLARRAKKLHPGLKVLLTTGYSEGAVERMGVGGEEFELINKPYGREDLGKRVRMVLDGPTGVA